MIKLITYHHLSTRSGKLHIDKEADNERFEKYCC